MARNYYPVHLPFLRRTVEVEEQTGQSHAQQWLKVLKEWRSAKADAFCQCIGPNKVCFLHVRKVKESYYVARNSRTGHLHQDDCRFHGFNLGSTEHAYTAGVIEEDDDGHLRIRLDHGRRVGSPAASASTGVAPAAAQAAGGTGNARKRAMTLLGLLHLLWELGGIHRHRPQWNATRNWTSIGGRLVDAARKIVWTGASLGDALIVGDTPFPRWITGSTERETMTSARVSSQPNDGWSLSVARSFRRPCSGKASSPCTSSMCRIFG